MQSCLVPFQDYLSRLLPVLALSLAGAAAMAQSGPAGLTHMEGSVAFAPAGATEWSDATSRRPITRGDRLWTDKGGRAELQVASATLHMDSEAFVEIVALGRDWLQASLNEGTVNIRVRQVEGDPLEINSPQLTFKALQPGDYRIDVDPGRGTTRVAVRSGTAMLFGVGGGALQLQAGQQMAFSGRDLKVAGQAAPLDQGFDRWAADRNRIEDRLIASRRAQQAHAGQQQSGSSRAAPNWHPNQHGHWQWIAPWGWTWVQPRMHAAPPQATVQPRYPQQGGWRLN